MKTIFATLAFSIWASGAAFASNEVSEICESFGEFTIAVFEARTAGQSASAVAMETVEAGGDTDTKEAFAAIIEAVYALDIPKDKAKAEAQEIDFAAEMILACEEG